MTRCTIPKIIPLVLISTLGALIAQRALSASEVNPEDQGFKEFHDRVEHYEKIHKQAEKSLPKLKKTAREELITARQQALVDRIRELRGNAHRGDIFTPSATQEITHVIKSVFGGPDSHRVQSTIQAGNPLQGFEVQVDQRYPDGLPFTTVPPTLLRGLPGIPDEVEYRILGSTLLIVDRKANMIVDFMPNAIPLG